MVYLDTADEFTSDKMITKCVHKLKQSMTIKHTESKYFYKAKCSKRNNSKLL